MDTNKKLIGKKINDKYTIGKLKKLKGNIN